MLSCPLWADDMSQYWDHKSNVPPGLWPDFSQFSNFKNIRKTNTVAIWLQSVAHAKGTSAFTFLQGFFWTTRINLTVKATQVNTHGTLPQNGEKLGNICQSGYFLPSFFALLFIRVTWCECQIVSISVSIHDEAIRVLHLAFPKLPK